MFVDRDVKTVPSLVTHTASWERWVCSKLCPLSIKGHVYFVAWGEFTPLMWLSLPWGVYTPLLCVMIVQSLLTRVYTPHQIARGGRDVGGINLQEVPSVHQSTSCYTFQDI